MRVKSTLLVMGAEQGKRFEAPLWSTPEINVTWYGNYTGIKTKKLNKNNKAENVSQR